MSNKKTQTTKNDASQMSIVIGILFALVAVMVVIGILLAVKLVKNTPEKAPEETKVETNADTKPNADMTAIKAEINSLKAADFTDSDKAGEYVKITVKDHGDIIVRLRADIAPITVKNFQDLVSEKFYDGLTIHRVSKNVSKNFVIQGGDPKGDGTGGSDPIKGEFSANNVQNDLEHIKGVISMARRSDSMDSGSCQFFICTADARTSLDGKYAGFGYVVAGLDVVDSIAAVEVNDETPVDKIVIEKISFVNKK